MLEKARGVLALSIRGCVLWQGRAEARQSTVYLATQNTHSSDTMQFREELTQRDTQPRRLYYTFTSNGNSRHVSVWPQPYWKLPREAIASQTLP